MAFWSRDEPAPCRLAMDSLTEVPEMFMRASSGKSNSGKSVEKQLLLDDLSDRTESSPGA